MDGLECNDGVIVVATTNDLAAIEPALSERPSRFDVVLEVGLPAADARRRILAQHLQRQSADAEVLDRAAAATEGCSGAQVREVAFRAVQRAILRGAVDRLGLAQVDDLDLQTAGDQVLGKQKRSAIGFCTSSTPRV
jgi:SpoVK/Ycf46/Vps4 family AAA+-type ATPase